MSPEIMLAVALLGAGAAFVVAELHLPTHGILGAGGVLGMLLGAFLLLAPPEIAALGSAALLANGWLLAIPTSTFVAFGGVALWAGYRVRRLPAILPLAMLPGALGVAASPLAPGGTVRVRNETWSAVCDGGPVEAGEEVEVIAREGLTLHVRRMTPRLLRELGTLPSQGEIRPGVRVQRTR